ncbi:MAG: tRNA pseudouridine(55) synthase TruB [bacterium]
MQNNQSSGFLIINKPIAVSSFDCVKRIKKKYSKNTKIGHTGTLDNEASGLLIICAGREATRSVPLFMNLNKEYVIKAKLGELTETLDYSGKIVQETNNLIITRQEIEQAIKDLGSSYMQTPPVYSALKHQGEPLYKLARHKIIEHSQIEEIAKTKQREVQILNIELLDFTLPFFIFKVTVSKGTYIRSLANDIAQKANTVATTYELTRTKIGNCSLETAFELDKIVANDDISGYLVTLEELKLIVGIF